MMVFQIYQIDVLIMLLGYLVVLNLILLLLLLFKYYLIIENK
jgi:hypothetical protein